MKTIAITSFHPLISRNILLTSFLAELTRDPEIKILILAPGYKRAFFETTFGAPGCKIIGVDHQPSRADTLILDLALVALKTRSMAIRRYWEFKGHRNFVTLALKWGLAFIMSGRAWAGHLVRWLDRRFGSRGEFRNLLAGLKPDLVFATDIQHESDLACMRAARDLGIPILGMTRSWDNPTAKGLARIVPEMVAVQNELLRRELVGHHRFPAERIAVVGIPHYDRYPAYRARKRKEFFSAIGLNPQMPLILVAPIGDRHIRDNVTDRELLELLVRARSHGKLPPDIQMLVRLPPTIPVSLGDFRPPPWMVIERPGRQFASSAVKDSELDAEDETHLLDSLAWCELVITGPSTLAIDAAVFDKPIILVAFDNGGRGYWESIRAWYDYDHFGPILRSNGARLARDGPSCLAAASSYLDDPSAERAGRRRIVEEQCWRLDGGSSRRLARLITAGQRRS